jgi:acyl carrier protein
MKMTTFERTRRFIARRLEIDEAAITPERTLESLGVDSLARLELLFDAEDEFGVRLPHDDGHITTPRELVAAIERELARHHGRDRPAIRTAAG